MAAGGVVTNKASKIFCYCVIPFPVFCINVHVLVQINSNKWWYLYVSRKWSLCGRRGDQMCNSQSIHTCSFCQSYEALSVLNVSNCIYNDYIQCWKHCLHSNFTSGPCGHLSIHVQSTLPRLLSVIIFTSLVCTFTVFLLCVPEWYIFIAFIHYVTLLIFVSLQPFHFIQSKEKG